MIAGAGEVLLPALTAEKPAGTFSAAETFHRP